MIPVHLPAYITRNKTGLIALLLFFVVWKTFVSCLGNTFSNYDDAQYVYDNPHVISGLTLANVRWAFTSSTVGNWHPLTSLSHILDSQFFGGWAPGHHFVSIVFHCLNSMLVFLLFERMTGALWKSFWAALLFGIHPLRVESVAWVAERKDVLSTFFFLLTAFAYARYAAESKRGGTRSRQYFRLAVLCLFLGLMCKPMLVTVPCVLLLLDIWPLARWTPETAWSLLREKAAFFILAGVFSVTALFTQHAGMLPLTYMPLSVRVENVPVAYCRYVGKLIYPVNLACLYPYPIHWPAVLVIGCTLVFLIASAAVAFIGRRRAYVLVGFLWFVGTLFPVIGLMQAGSQSLADRYSYIPSLGLVVMAVWGVSDLAERCKFSPAGLWALGLGLAVTCMALTRRQISFWKDPESQWRHAAAVTVAFLAFSVNFSHAVFGGTGKRRRVVE